MFIKNQSEEQREKYFTLLKTIGSLSNLFSDSPVPYLYYRAHENAFCRAFGAENLSRTDCSADARKDNIGIGLKTFLENNSKTFQKVAEFNKNRNLYSQFENDPDRLVRVVSEMRNLRISTTNALHAIENSIYHCVTREKGRFLIYEQKMDLIDIENITITGRKKNSVSFSDDKNEYKFNISKSTLSKKFITENPLIVDVEILKDPFEELERFFSALNGVFDVDKSALALPKVYLPLYSLRGEKHVPERSGLNQWNANGRPRDKREVYIPIPAWIHKDFDGFFPDRGNDFKLHLPNNEVIDASVCQDGGKALMSNPNFKLGNWLINDVLRIPEGEIVTYELLEKIGIDSVVVYKMDEGNYKIEFRPLGSYESFEDTNRT